MKKKQLSLTATIAPILVCPKNIYTMVVLFLYKKNKPRMHGGWMSFMNVLVIVINQHGTGMLTHLYHAIEGLHYNESHAQSVTFLVTRQDVVMGVKIHSEYSLNFNDLTTYIMDFLNCKISICGQLLILGLGIHHHQHLHNQHRQLYHETVLSTTSTITRDTCPTTKKIIMFTPHRAE